MVKTDDFIVSRIIWKAKKHNLPTNFSFFYNDLSNDVQQYLANYFDIETCGQPVLFFTKPSKEWTLVCTRKVISSDNEQIVKLNINEIDSFKPTIFDNVSKGHLTTMKEGKKTEWHQVTVFDKNKSSFILHADKGSDLFALWNVLLMVVRLYN